MKLTTLIALIFIAFFVSVIVHILYENAQESVCYSACYKADVDCDHNDNDCKYGAHYCGDMCYGGIVQPLKYELMEMAEPVFNIFFWLVLLIIIVFIYDLKRNIKKIKKEK